MAGWPCPPLGDLARDCPFYSELLLCQQLSQAGGFESLLKIS